MIDDSLSSFLFLKLNHIASPNTIILNKKGAICFGQTDSGSGQHRVESAKRGLGGKGEAVLMESFLCPFHPGPSSLTMPTQIEMTAYPAFPSW